MALITATPSSQHPDTLLAVLYIPPTLHLCLTAPQPPIYLFRNRSAVNYFRRCRYSSLSVFWSYGDETGCSCCGSPQLQLLRSCWCRQGIAYSTREWQWEWWLEQLAPELELLPTPSLDGPSDPALHSVLQSSYSLCRLSGDPHPFCSLYSYSDDAQWWIPLYPYSQHPVFSVYPKSFWFFSRLWFPTCRWLLRGCFRCGVGLRYESSFLHWCRWYVLWFISCKLLIHPMGVSGDGCIFWPDRLEMVCRIQGPWEHCYYVVVLGIFTWMESMSISCKLLLRKLWSLVYKWRQDSACQHLIRSVGL